MMEILLKFLFTGLVATASNLSQFVSGASGVPCGGNWTTSSKSSNYTVVVSDRCKYFQVSGSSIVTLPSAVTAGNNFYLKFRNSGNETVRLTPNGAETIGEAPNLYLGGQNAMLTLASDGSNWQIRDYTGDISTPIPGAKKEFFYVGVEQYFTVPSGWFSVTVKAWGAGGGGGSGPNGGTGGGGGAVAATLSVTPGEVLIVRVGGGGKGGIIGVSAPGGWPGGGAGGSSLSGQAGGSGGGYTGIFRGTNVLAIAGGGGGGAGEFARNGGVGGSPGGSASSGYPGSGGTLSAGGAGCTTGTLAGGSGQSLRGGDAPASTSSRPSGAGGGAGYYGGGSGCSGSSSDTSGGGGGGSNYLSAGGIAYNGSGTSAGNNSDSLYIAGDGVAGAAGAPGSSGRLIILMNAP